MIGELIFITEGKHRPAYCLDLVGNLIRCGATGPADGLVPFGISLVTTAGEIECPNPWSISTDSVLSRLSSLEEALPGSRVAYPGLTLARSPYPFVPHIEVTEDDDTIAAAINLFPGLEGDDARAVQAELEANGVFIIPSVSTFSPGIHEAVGDGLTVPPLETVAVGWMSSMKVYRKALVRSA